MRLFDAGIRARIIAAALGLWLMAAPDVLGYGPPAAVNDRLVGPIATSLAIISLWEVTRPLRNLNSGIGLWLLIAPLVLGYGGAPAINSIVVGLVLIVCSRIRGQVRERLGGGWSALRSR